MLMPSFTIPSEGPTANDELLWEYEQFLSGKAERTIEAYLRTIGHLLEWIAARPGQGHHFLPQQLTKTVVEMYLAQLEREGYSASIIVRGSNPLFGRSKKWPIISAM
jgi:site-specific recombinase XerD